MLKALLWDVDGTVAETERDGHRVAFNLAFADAGLDWGWTESAYGDLLHVTGGRERLLAFMDQRHDAPDSAAARQALALRLHERKNRFYAELVAQGHLPPRPGVVGVMREARASGLSQAIVTTTSRSNVQALMPTLLGEDWAETFAVVLCGEDTQRKKPDPEVYLLALQRLGLPATHCLAIEDSTPGARAAHAAGVPLVLRPSVYFPATTLPEAIPGQLCTDDATFRLSDLRRWHERQYGAVHPA